MAAIPRLVASESQNESVGALDAVTHPIVLAAPRHLTEISAWHYHIPFAFYLTQLMRPRTFVELGTHFGDSYCAFCQAVSELSLDASCYAVDTWDGEWHAGFYSEEVLRTLQEYHDPLYGRFSRLVRSTFDAALAQFADGSIDLLHIDGLHEYDAVKHDFDSWLPKTSKEAVVLLHDTNVRERSFGVWRLWEEISQRYPSRHFKFGHGLGIVGVGSRLSPAVKALLELAPDKWSELESLLFALGNRCYLLGNERHFGRMVARRDIELELARKEIAQLETSLEQARDALNRAKVSVGDAHNERDAAMRQVEAIHNSTSWRVTRPLRVVAPLMRHPGTGLSQH